MPALTLPARTLPALTLPALTLPFCFATLAFVLLKGSSTKLEAVEVADITTPEEHLARSRAQTPAGTAPVPA